MNDDAHHSDASARVASPADIEAVVATLTTAFLDDPLWRPEFPDDGRRAPQMAALWQLFATGAVRFPWVLVTPQVEAAALWIPPGESELTHEQEDGFEAFLIDLGGRAVAASIMAMFGQFEEARPREPHFYLSLLGTHQNHRGNGIGMRLLAASLARIDALGQAAYLESSNPTNDRRYEGVGFVRRGEFRVASGNTVTTMWRPSR